MSIIKNIIRSFFVLLLGCSSIFAEDNNYVNKELAKSVEQKMLLSSQVVVRHIPNISIGNRLWEVENIQNDWDYKLTKRCSKNCGGRRTNLLTKILLQGVKQADECPLPLNTLISLVSYDDKSILNIYFHQSGHCFVIGERSYYSKIKLKPLIDFKNL